MRRLIFLSAIFLSPALCSAQIGILDYGSPAPIKTTTVLNLSEPITVSTGASVLVVDVATYNALTFANFGFTYNGAALTQATGILPTTGVKIGSAIYYLDNPPPGTLTLAGSFNYAQGAVVDYYTLSNVNTAVAPIAASVNGGTATTCTLSLSGTTGDFAAIEQGVTSAGNHTSTAAYTSTSGAASTLTTAFASGDVFGSDGAVLGLANGSNTFTASVNANAGANHPLSVALFAPAPISGPPSWIGSSGSWSVGANWNTGSAPNAAGATAVFSQSGATTETITLDISPSLGALQLGSTAGGMAYDLTGGTLVLNNSGSGATISVNGNEQIDSAISGSESLTVQGTGQLILSSSQNSFTGGLDVESGTVVINNSAALPDGSSLTVGAGGTFVFDPSVSAGSVAPAAESAGRVEAVPEPSALALVAAALAVLLFARKPIMKKCLLASLIFVLSAASLYAGEGGTGLGSPEPCSIGLLAAAVLFGVPRYFVRRRRLLREIDDAQQE